MPRISRRHLIASGIAFSGSSFLSHSVWARAASMPQGAGSSGTAGTIPPDPVRETLLFDFGWKFKFGHGSDPAKDLGFGIGQICVISEMHSMTVIAKSPATVNAIRWRFMPCERRRRTKVAVYDFLRNHQGFEGRHDEHADANRPVRTTRR